MTQTDGLQAFPRFSPDDEAKGMTLRDYFAAQALIATYMNGFAGPEDSQRAALCYRMADAMLTERSKEDSK